jgi:ribosome assembly protein YihI (activator of Der GTPase)
VTDQREEQKNPRMELLLERFEALVELFTDSVYVGERLDRMDAAMEG